MKSAGGLGALRVEQSDHVLAGILRIEASRTCDGEISPGRVVEFIARQL